MKHLRFFGLSMAIFFALIAYLMFTRGHSWYEIPGSAALATLFTTVLFPHALAPFERAVSKTAHFIGAINSAVILSVIYFLIFMPVGILLRVFGRDLLEEKDRGAASYWKNAEHETTKESYEQFF